MSTLYGDNIFESNINFLYRSVMESNILFEDFDISINESVGEKIKQTIETIITKVKEFFKWLKNSVQAFFRGLKKGLNSDIEKKAKEAKSEASKDSEKKSELDKFFNEYAPIGFMGQSNAKNSVSHIDDLINMGKAFIIGHNDEEGCKRYYADVFDIETKEIQNNYVGAGNLFVLYNENGHVSNETFIKGYKYWIEDLEEYIDCTSKTENKITAQLNTLKSKTYKSKEEYDKAMNIAVAITRTIAGISPFIKDCTAAAKKINDYAIKCNVILSKYSKTT